MKTPKSPKGELELLSIYIIMKYFLLIGFITQFLPGTNTYCQPYNSKTDLVYISSNYGQKTNTIIQLKEQLLPARYEANLNLPVCDDNLCANVVLKMYWDLAGNYTGFDTLKGKPLTKFDHRPFTPADYQKLNEILSDKNNILRVLGKDELTDKSVKLKSSTVDAVTGATPASVKDQVVEGAVYTAFTLWHFVNGAVKDSIKSFTINIFSDKSGEQLLQSNNHETQIFALKQLQDTFYETHSKLIFSVLTNSSPLVRAYIINKIPLPLSTLDKNNEFASLYTNLDSYSQSIFRERIVSSKSVAEVFIPLLTEIYKGLDETLSSKMQLASKKYGIRH